MSAIDDDATVSQLATAWVGVQLGGAKVQEAAYIYQELGDKFSWTVRGEPGAKAALRGTGGHWQWLLKAYAARATGGGVRRGPCGRSDRCGVYPGRRGRMPAAGAPRRPHWHIPVPPRATPTPKPQAKLHAGLATCHMKMGEWEDAERDLLEGLGVDAKDADVLAGLISVALHLGKPAARYAQQLKALAPGHPAARRYEAGEELFARAAAAVS
jgi:tetratricopeptide (TPR) repeat protein